jgi:hypothetical protein
VLDQGCPGGFQAEGKRESMIIFGAVFFLAVLAVLWALGEIGWI